MKNSPPKKEKITSLLGTAFYYASSINLCYGEDEWLSRKRMEEELKDLGFDEEDVQDICERVAQNRV